MTRPWMPLYIGDYRADTAHLGALEHGIYLLLIMHYWQTGSLPTDDKQLARVACATDTEWRRCKATIEKFFMPGWKHGRVEFELTQAARLSAAGKKGGEASGRARRATSNGSTTPTIDERSTNDPPTRGEALQPLSSSQVERKFFLNGSAKAKSWTPAAHGRTGQGRIYIETGSEEWKSYAEDYKQVHHREPTPNRHGGKWFKVLGEQTG